jgi:cytochrome P450
MLASFMHPRTRSRAWLAAPRQAFAFQRRPVSTLLEHAQAGEDAFALATLIAGRTCVVATPDLAHEVLHAKPGCYRAGRANRRILPVLPEGTVLTLDGDEHRARRQALAPLFHGDSLAELTPIIRDIAAIEIAQWPIGRPFAVLPRTRFMALCIAARLLLGVEGQALVGELERHLTNALRPYSMLAGIDRLAHLGPASPQAFAARCRAGFTRGVAQVRVARGPGPHSGPPDALDVLGAAVDSRDDAGESRIAGELFALLLAGHETTATALAWAIQLLARDPDTAAALANETGDRLLMDAVISEVLRLRPPLVDIVRELAEPARLGTHELDAATIILIPPPVIHQHTEVAPETFIADRFLGRRPDPRTWLPFGGGERRCLGASLALLELREILAQLVGRFELQPAIGRPEDARLHGTALIPGRGGQVLLQPR